MKMLPIVLLLFIPSLFLSADELSAGNRLNLLSGYLGRSLEQVLEEEGLPDAMHTVRGPSAGQDSVVFDYEGRLSLFWAESHVWQLRVLPALLPPEGELQMGMSREELVEVLGPADLEKGEFLLYVLPQRGYPVSCALYFDEEGLNDLYVYRSDF